MKLLRAAILGLLITTLAVSLAYCATDNKTNNNGKGKGRITKTIKRNNHPARGKPIKIKEAALQRNLIKREQEQMEKREHQKYGKVPYRFVDTDNEIILSNLEDALRKLGHTRYSYNPHDQRGQGNMGKVDMLAPYGHDKDSDRMELYGNRGRVIRTQEAEPVLEPVSEPVPVPEPIPEPEPEPEPEPVPIPEPMPQPPF